MHAEKREAKHYQGASLTLPDDAIAEDVVSAIQRGLHACGRKSDNSRVAPQS